MIAAAAGWRELHVGKEWWPMLDEQAERWGINEIWEGGAEGADEGVRIWAGARGIQVESFPAPWELFKQAKMSNKAAGPRRIEDMLEGRRGYRLGDSKHDPEAISGIVTTEQLSGRPGVLIALPGHQGTRRTIRAARDRGIIVDRIALEPQVINHYHFSGKGDRLPPKSRWIQRGKSPLANPFRKDQVPDALGAYRRWLWDKMQNDKRVQDELASITPLDHLVCSCVRPDGKVMDNGQGACHGHVIVAAWRYLQTVDQCEKKLQP